MQGSGPRFKKSIDCKKMKSLSLIFRNYAIVTVLLSVFLESDAVFASTTNLGIEASHKSNSQKFAQAQAPNQFSATPSVPCDDADAASTLAAKFAFRSATFANSNDMAIRVTLSVQNTLDKPLGILLLSRETSGSTDTGLNFVVSSVSGMSFCSQTRDECVKSASFTGIGPHSSTSIIINFIGQRYLEQVKALAEKTRTLVVRI